MKRSDIVCVRIYIYNYLHTPGCLILGKLIREKGRSWEANPNPSLSPKKKARLTGRAPCHCPNKLDALPQSHLKSTKICGTEPGVPWSPNETLVECSV